MISYTVTTTAWDTTAPTWTVDYWTPAPPVSWRERRRADQRHFEHRMKGRLRRPRLEWPPRPPAPCTPPKPWWSPRERIFRVRWRWNAQGRCSSC